MIPRVLPALPLALAALAAAAEPAAPAATELAPGVRLLPGRVAAGEQPDGNSLLLTAPQGLIVVDTGRHADHVDRLLALARSAGKPVAAIVNTHWHLDHLGGNPALRKAWPGARVWQSGALAGARKGFLAEYREQLQGVLKKATDPGALAQARAELAILDAGKALDPDVVVKATGEQVVAGRRLRIGVAPRAVTAADLWILDPATGVLAAGDLVTLPVPFLDTACPSGWQAALRALRDERWILLVPGHGPPLSRGDLAVYAAGLDHLLACAATDRPAPACVEGWLGDLGELVRPEERPLAAAMLSWYVQATLRGDEAALAARCAGR